MEKLAEELGISIDRKFNEQLKGVSRDVRSNASSRTAAKPSAKPSSPN